MKIKEPDLDSIVSNLYGNRLIKYKNIKSAYSFFTAFKDTQTDQIIYFYILKTQAKNHLSDGTINYALKNYNPFLSKVQFLQILKNFEHSYYLIKTDNYLICLEELISLQKECQQMMDKDYILKTIKFLIDIYKVKKCHTFPQLTPKSIGINQQGNLKICDYEFYFKKNFEFRSLTQNICSCIIPMIKTSVFKSSPRVLTLQNQYEKLKDFYGESFANLIKTLALNPMEDMQKQGVINGQGKQINIKKIEEALEEYYKTAQVNGDTTLNQTFQEDYKDQNTGNKFLESDLLTRDSVKQPFLFNDQTKKLKRKRYIKIASFIMMIFLIGIGALVFSFYNSREIECDVGTFRSKEINQCLSCSEGCLRCDSQVKTSCFSCSGKMYLVLVNQNDTTGSCQTTCVGTVLKSNLCLKSKNSNNTQQSLIIDEGLISSTDN